MSSVPCLVLDLVHHINSSCRPTSSLSQPHATMTCRTLCLIGSTYWLTNMASQAIGAASLFQLYTTGIQAMYSPCNDHVSRTFRRDMPPSIRTIDQALPHTSKGLHILPTPSKQQHTCAGSYTSDTSSRRKIQQKPMHAAPALPSGLTCDAVPSTQPALLPAVSYQHKKLILGAVNCSSWTLA